MIDHVNEFNLIISRLILVDIGFENEVMVLLLLSSNHVLSTKVRGRKTNTRDSGRGRSKSKN